MNTKSHWPRAIILADMNAFFASIEQQDRPELRSRPVAVTNGLDGTCIITCSYEARAYGIHTGMRLKEARRLCPELVRCPSRPERYAQVSTTIMTALAERISPDIEVFSVDEAFLDVSRCQRLLGPPESIARQTKETIREVTGLPCSIGVSGDKTTAKYAAKLNKPDGLTVIPPWEAENTLKEVPVTELCGIANGIGDFLKRHGVRVCGDMKKLPISVLAQRFGNPGRRIWYMCQGKDPEPLHLDVPAPKSIGHGKIMPPNTQSEDVIVMYLLHMSEKVAARLRRHHMQARKFYIALRTRNGWLAEKRSATLPTSRGQVIMTLCHEFLEQNWWGQGVFQVQITALDPAPANLQRDLFAENHTPHPVHKVMDEINQRYGEFTLTPARLLDRSKMPNVISPAWKPFGHRETVSEKRTEKSDRITARSV